MSKSFVIILLAGFIIYLILGLIISIPKSIDTFIMGAAALGAIWYVIFETKIVSKVKNDFNKEIDKNIDKE
ncbi:hypothetical protein J2O02_18275 (plasmid) [Elizabethkingia anophelis]|uniref:hypothetical protein n=1 Tax=Elizabethkingia anophelis TaxID=1117645 RepID=UPI0020B69CEC|nr:hypothetical protein [Elizabethkingia anophelis]UTG66813.1 hypothetical protein J2O02_18275 [Elizabethkingia anophelis]